VVFDPTTGEHIRYETFFPDRESHYSKSACERLRTALSDGEMSDDEDHHHHHLEGRSEVDVGRDRGSGDMDVSIDDDDTFEDEMILESTGICDILITGEASLFFSLFYDFFLKIVGVCIRLLNATARLGANSIL
jgi:hypothetical protein